MIFPRFVIMLVRRRLVLLGCAAALVGCGASGTPQSLPRVSVGPASYEVPASARADSPAAAAAFVRFFYAQVSAGYASAHSAGVRALSLTSCATCLRYIRSIDQLNAKQQRATPVLFWIRFAESPADDDAAVARVDVQYDAPASARYDAAGHKVLQEKALLRQNHTVTLRRVGATWKVATIA
jgi:hypothetical protein